MRYILDFDRVLFNVWSYKAELKEKGIEALNFTPAVWEQIAVTDHMYDDVVPFLLAHDPADCVIMSAVTMSYAPQAREFQEQKLRECGLEEFVESVVIMEGDKGPYVAELATAGPTVFVDDRLSNLTSTKTLAPHVQCVQMIRPEGQSEDGAVSTEASIPVIAQLKDIDDVATHKS